VQWGGGAIAVTAATDAIRVPKAAELVAAPLRRQIITGELSEGDALPSEAALMTQFRISRATLREAFRILESESLMVRLSVPAVRQFPHVR
jgi:DNA-binding FadR family transcriptional regulator